MLHSRSRTSALSVAVAAAAGLVAVGVGLAPASANDPAGNNGTVKIAPDGEMDGIPQNHPHEGCTFQIEWYGFDEGDDIVSTVEFAMQAPTADVALSGDDPSEVWVGEDPATGAGTDSGLDAVQSYTLSFDGAPHPKQGYHVKLTVHTPGSVGADTKHKVFWVTGCEASTPEESTGTTSTLPTDTTDTSGTTATTSVAGTGATGTTGTTATTVPTTSETTLPGDDESTAGSQATSTAVPVPSEGSTPGDVEVAGEQAASPAGAEVPTVVDAGEQGGVARLGGSSAGLLVAGAGLLLGLGALLVRRRRA